MEAQSLPVEAQYGTGSRQRPGANPVSTPRGAWGSSRCVAADTRRCFGRANDLERQTSRLVSVHIR